MTQDAFLSGVNVDAELETKAVNAIRLLSAEGVEAAKAGHPGMPMGMAQGAFSLWGRYLRFNPANPDWANRDRFILSAGHGSMLLYSLLHLTGFDLSIDDLSNFRQLGSKTPGHPEREYPGVEMTTGPLGQGFTSGVGMAMAERWLADRFNRPGHDIVDHYTYAIVSDGDLMEGISSEAASLAGHLKLSKIVYLYDNNSITIDGTTDVSFTEDWAKRFDAYGWHVQEVDGNDGAAIAAAIAAAKADRRPSIIGCKSIIGFGSPNKANTPGVHGAPLGADEMAATKENLDWPQEPNFYVPDEVRTLFSASVEHGQKLQAAYDAKMAAYAEEYPAEAAEYAFMLSGKLADGWEESLPTFAAGGAIATRSAGGKVINAIAGAIPNLVGGSADLAASNNTTIDGQPFVDSDSFAGPNLHFGVREHAMAGIANGMMLHGGVHPYVATFLVFADYMRGSMRLSAIMGVPVTYVLTHDGIGVGEDGPTHQPVEQIASLRVMPNMTVIRPADANETAQAWRAALLNTDGPTALALTRQNLPIYDREGEGLGSAEGVLRGGYVFYENAATKLDLVLIGTGSEVGLAYDAAKQLAAEGVGVRVVSLPSFELFAAQDADYIESVLRSDLPKVAVEAGTTFGWERWVGNDPAKGAVIGLDQFGSSGPGPLVYEKFGITADAVVAKAKELLG